MIRAEQAGEAAPELVAERTQLELRAGHYAVRFDGTVMDRGTFEIGGTPDVRTLLLRGLAGPNAGRTLPCIYQLAGDRLRICFGLDGVAPLRFATTEGDSRYLATYRRTEA